jgi:hypothetical protein
MAVVAGGVQLTGLATVVGAILGQHLAEDKPKAKL